MSNIVTSTIRLGDIFLTENELPMIEAIGYHKDCITDIVTNEDICITASLDKTCRSWRQGRLLTLCMIYCSLFVVLALEIDDYQ